MKLTLDLQISDALLPLQTERVNKKKIKHWIETCLSAFQEKGNSQTTNNAYELSIRVVDIEESRALNHQYRNKAKPTNVLSFPAELPENLNLPLLGDLVICHEIVEAEAQSQNKTPDAHWAHMCIHGTLHLLGYDHIHDDEAETMESLEIEILNRLHFPNPYLM